MHLRKSRILKPKVITLQNKAQLDLLGISVPRLKDQMPERML